MSREQMRAEVASWTAATCQECGNTFPQRKDYEVLCPICFKLDKDYKLLWGDQALFWMQERMQALQAELKQTEKALAQATVVKGPAPFGEGTLKKLILLCHPDRHDNSPLSNEVTQLLLSMRKKKKSK